MAINLNADDYANARLNIFFPASSNNTLADGDLTGQCVSLVKWFLQEMTSVPGAPNARGHAKDYGPTLVAQGHAREVSAAERRRGDLVAWPQDGGGYGHIGVLLSGDRVFEENVGLAGTASRVIYSGRESWTVYASRIDPLYTSWRRGAPKFYRINTYFEEEPEVKIGTEDNWRWRFNRFHHQIVGNWDMGDDTWNSIKGKDAWDVLEQWSDHPNADQLINDQVLGQEAREKNWAGKITDLEKQLAEKPKEVLVVKEVPVEKIVEKEVIKEVIKGDEDRSVGELLTVAFRKLFKIK